MASKTKPHNNKRILPKLLIVIGLATLAGAALIVGAIYLPLIGHEINYELTKTSAQTPKEILPIDTEFGLVINKINANARIIKAVDPFNSSEYQIALSKGIAHAKTSALPGEGGNIFLFSHSSSDLGLATRYNSIFYLLDKLETGDTAEIYYQNKKYTYILSKKIIVDPVEVSYLDRISTEPTLTLMTCWPPGTSLKRLIASFTILTND